MSVHFELYNWILGPCSHKDGILLKPTVSKKKKKKLRTDEDASQYVGRLD